MRKYVLAVAMIVAIAGLAQAYPGMGAGAAASRPAEMAGMPPHAADAVPAAAQAGDSSQAPVHAEHATTAPAGEACCPHSTTQPAAATVPPATQPALVNGRPAWAGMNFALFRLLPVQYGGRIVPVDTVASETVWEVTGKRSWRKLDAGGLMLAWTWQNQAWRTEPVILVGNPELQKQIRLATDRKHFSHAELAGNTELLNLVMEAQKQARAKKPLSALQRSAGEVWQRIAIFDEVGSGARLRIVPAVQDARGEWRTVAQAAQAGVSEAAAAQIRTQWDQLRANFLAADRPAFLKTSETLDKTLNDLNAASWPDRNLIALEFLYNYARPFYVGWIATCLAMVVGLLSLAWQRKWIRWIAWILLVDGFAALTVGIAVRWKFSGHAPLATMYESLVFMGWGVAAIGLVVMWLVKHRAALPIVAAVTTAILVVADASSLDSTAEPLQPVLRNTAWLTIHVLTIMLAYSAFALGMGLGHVQAASLALKPAKREWTDSLGRLLYGVTLTGCVFLTAGIIFGAIWASKSWGRYWGWDPKETWSLITLLGYLVLLHGRRVNWFGLFGDAVASIFCFQLVIMTYYGVNFVLGQGLHSYGFSSGGQLWIGLYVLVEVAFVAWAWATRQRNLPSGSPAPAVQEPATK